MACNVEGIRQENPLRCIKPLYIVGETTYQLGSPDLFHQKYGPRGNCKLQIQMSLCNDAIHIHLDYFPGVHVSLLPSKREWPDGHARCRGQMILPCVRWFLFICLSNYFFASCPCRIISNACICLAHIFLPNRFVCLGSYCLSKKESTGWLWLSWQDYSGMICLACSCGWMILLITPLSVFVMYFHISSLCLSHSYTLHGLTFTYSGSGLIKFVEITAHWNQGQKKGINSPKGSN